MATIKNLQSLEKLLSICTGLGEKYKPGNQKLQVEAMTTLLSQAQTITSEVNVARTAYENAANSRENAFADLKHLSTRMLGALIASGASAQTVDDAKAMTRKIAGSRTVNRPPVPAEGNSTAAGGTIVSKPRAHDKNFVSATGYFEKLIETVAAEANYQPNESDLQVASLREKLAQFRGNNSNLIGAVESLRQVRSQRDQVLFQQSNSVYNVGRMAKQYVKSVYGFKNDNHKAVAKLVFTKRLA